MTETQLPYEAPVCHAESQFTHEPYSGLPLADTRHVLTFTIPLAPSLNNAYPTNWRTGRRYLSKAGNDFKTEVGTMARVYASSADWEAGSGPLGLRLVMWFPNKRRTDLDGRIKLAQDAIADGLSIDDSRFDELHVYRAGVSDDPRCEVSVWTI